MAEKLLESLDDDPSMEERELMDIFIRQFSKRYEFHDSKYRNLLEKIVTQRLEIEEFVLRSEFYSYVLKLLQVVRILTRESSIQDVLIQTEGVELIAKMLKHYAHQHFSDFSASYISEMLVEIASTFRRLATNPMIVKSLVKNDIPELLTLLLGSTHAIVARSTLETLLALASDKETINQLEKTSIIELLIRICNDYTQDYILLASNLINILCQREEMSRQLRIQRGNLLMLQYDIYRQLQKSKDLPTRLALMRVIQTLCMDSENIGEFRYLNLIQILAVTLKEDCDPLEIISAIAILTEMSLDDETALVIRAQAVHIIAKCVINYHPCRKQKETDENLTQARYEIQLFALRCLRYLYSLERNRKFFKKIFSPAIFASFIDVGNYNKDIRAYQETLHMINNLSSSEIDAMEISILEMKDLGFSGTIKNIGGYTVTEIIGKGAYGIVYEVQKGSNRYALKEVPLQSLEDLDVDRSLPLDQLAEKFSKEVAIYKNLEHPNIIKYYTSFVENQALCIVMELIEGQPLSDYINSLKEKGQRLVEGQIWRLFIEMCAGLRYLHLDKKVVHRDLTPSNIMITRNLHVKIADFGLAKQRGVTHSTGHGNGFVGTIQYASPEVIQNNPYGDKADIWALGCILYELATLKPAFSGENPLAIARRVVEEDYERLSPKEFSPLLITVVSKCMTVNQDNRPDILQLSQMIGPILMLQVDELKAREQRLQDQLRKDRLRGVGELTPVTLKTQSIKKISDPMGALLTTIHKLIYISQQPPGLQRDPRRSNLESFKHWLFSDPSGSERMKEEIRKFHNCMREEIPILSREKVTYETLNFSLEELLTESKYYEYRDPATEERISSSIGVYNKDT